MSLGVHTFLLTRTVIESHALSIARDAKKFRDKTGEIVIMTDKEYLDSYKIMYHSWKGIRWRIRLSANPCTIPIYCIDAIITPRVLATEEPDYFTAADHSDIQIYS